MYKGSSLTIGDDFIMLSGDSINPISKNIKACIFLDNNAQLIIGNHVGMSSPTIWCTKRIELYNNVRLGGCFYT